MDSDSPTLFSSLGQLILLTIIIVCIGGTALIGVISKLSTVWITVDETSVFALVLARIGLLLRTSCLVGLVATGVGTIAAFFVYLGVLPPPTSFAWTPPPLSTAKSPKNLGRRRFHPHHHSVTEEEQQQQPEYDVIVIGSGIAGLTTASILTILGRRVCVLEAHEVAGGGTHEYHIGGNRHYTFPSGLHYVIPHCEQVLQISCLARTPPVRFPKLGIAGTSVYERLRLPRVSTEDLPIVHARQFMEELHQRYPALRKQLDRYEALAISMLKCFPLWCAVQIVPWSIRKHLLTILMPTVWWDYAQRSAEDVLTEVFADAPPDQHEQIQELQAYLCALWVDTGCPPHRVSFFMIAAVGVGLAHEGGAYPRGGPQAMSMTLVQRIEAKDGCHVFCRAPVHKIIRSTTTGTAIGVEVAGGTRIMAKECIVSACGWRNTSRLVGDDGGDKRFPPMEQLKVPQGEGFCMANIGLKGYDLNLECCNFWAQPAGRNQSIFDGVRNYLEHPLDVPVTEIPMMITFPSMKDRDYDTDVEFQTAQILVLAKTEWFGDIQDTTVPWKQPVRSEAYQTLKDRWTERLREAFITYYPHLKDKIDLFDVSTPHTIEHYLPSKSGSAIGLDVCADKKFCRFTSFEQMKLLDMKTPVPNLWMTGQDTLVCGVPLAQASGLITALRIAGPFGAAKFMFQAIWILLASMRDSVVQDSRTKPKEC